MSKPKMTWKYRFSKEYWNGFTPDSPPNPEWIPSFSQRWAFPICIGKFFFGLFVIWFLLLKPIGRGLLTAGYDRPPSRPDAESMDYGATPALDGYERVPMPRTQPRNTIWENYERERQRGWDRDTLKRAGFPIHGD